MGAIASGGVRVLNANVVRELGIAEDAVDRVAASELRELERRQRAYRDDRPAPPVRDRMVMLVDDGLATGSTMRASATAPLKLFPLASDRAVMAQQRRTMRVSEQTPAIASGAPPALLSD